MTIDVHRRCLRTLRVIVAMSLCLSSLPPLAQEAVPAAPVPAGAAESAGRLRITAQRQMFSPTLGLYQFFGRVTVTADNLRLQASELSYDAATDTVLAGGDVAVTPADGQTYYGTTLEYRPRAGTWAFRDWSAALPPALVGSPLLSPLYAAGSSMAPGPDGSLALHGAHLTTCDQYHPHYELVAGEVELYPGDKLIARDVDLYVANRRLLHLPWLFFPLGTRRLPIMPEAGRNDTEGFFVRLPYQYLLDENNLGTLRLDLTQKHGIGVGVDHFYTLGRGSGEAFAYLNTDARDYRLRLRHAQPLPADATLNLILERQRHTLGSATPTLITNLQASLQRSTEHTTSVLEVGRNATGGLYDNEATHVNLRQDFRTRDGSVSYLGEYRGSRYGAGSAADQEMWHHLQVTRRTGIGEVKLRMDQRTDVDGSAYPGDDQSRQLERLPELTLQTDNARLGLRALPGRMTVGWGLFRERSGDDAVGRCLLDWQATPTFTPSKRSSISLNTGFRQTLYGDTDRTGQYSYHADLNAQLQVGKLTGTLTYGLQQVEGYSPLAMDALYARHNIAQSLLYQTAGLRVALTGGRDLRWQQWQDIALTAEGTPRDGLTLRQTLGYDPNTGNWRDAVSQLTWQVDPQRALNLRTRYDLERGRLRATSAQFTWAFRDVWGLQWQGEHDGAKFFRNEWLITRDLHCWEAALHYDAQRGAFGISLRPKAFDQGIVPGLSLGDGRWDLNMSTTF